MGQTCKMFSNSHLSKAALAKYHEEVKIRGTDDILLAHVMWYILV